MDTTHSDRFAPPTCVVCGRTRGACEYDLGAGVDAATGRTLSSVSVCPRHLPFLSVVAAALGSLPLELRKHVALVLGGHLWEREALLRGRALLQGGAS